MDFDFLKEVEVQNNESTIQASSILEAFLKTYRLYNRVDLEEIKSITHCSDEQILEELKEIIVFNPAIQDYEVVFDYLSKDAIQNYKESKEYHCNEELMDKVISKISKFDLRQLRAISGESRVVEIMGEGGFYSEYREQIKYLPYDYPLKNFFKGKRNDYQRDYFLMLTNTHTVEVISNYTERIEVMKEYCQLVLENNLADEVTIVSNVKFKTGNSKIKIISSSKYLKEDHDWVVVHDVESFKNKTAVMNKLEQSKYSVLFLPAISEDFLMIASYLNQTYVNSQSWLTQGVSLAHNYEFSKEVTYELPVLFHNQLMMHMNHIHYEIEKVDVPNKQDALEMAKKLDNGLDHINLSPTQKSLLRNDISILGTTQKAVLKGSKFHKLAINVASSYLDDPEGKQIIYIDLDHSFENLDYRQVMKNLLIDLGVSEQDIVITNTKKYNVEAKVFIAKSRELVPESIEGLKCIHHLDLPELVEMYIRNSDVKQYLYQAHTLFDNIEIDRRSIYEGYYSNFTNDDYNFRQLNSIVHSFEPDMYQMDHDDELKVYDFKKYIEDEVK